MDFSNKVIIITGASSGIGASCALHFAALRAKLSLVARNVDKLRNVAEECEKISGTKPLTIAADISVEEDNARIIQETAERYGTLDVLVNNAGILIIAGCLDNIKIFDQMIATNVRGTYLLTQKAIPYLIETKGNIINVSSVVSQSVIPPMTAYSMTKAALDMFTKCAALELAPKGVRVNAINPGPVVTNLFKAGGFSDEASDDFYANMQKMMPLKKVSQADDIAKLITFLASDDAKCITGTTNLIDCGLHLGQPLL
ncbi:glucose 1-dehydrogenase-like isoform X1 [Leptidea sinapis]|uniref:glucose 1-dehydrogenase-like isoform X1 n=1 Tax=Leptidea sinapis TaxID=189913 RepID=UPI0021C2737E|nr:glucose 1-dehydrogenase-like isoform X1 [Leptidea sinapis]